MLSKLQLILIFYETAREIFNQCNPTFSMVIGNGQCADEAFCSYEAQLMFPLSCWICEEVFWNIQILEKSFAVLGSKVDHSLVLNKFQINSCMLQGLFFPFFSFVALTIFSLVPLSKLSSNNAKPTNSSDKYHSWPAIFFSIAFDILVSNVQNICSCFSSLRSLLGAFAAVLAVAQAST